MTVLLESITNLGYRADDLLFSRLMQILFVAVLESITSPGYHPDDPAQFQSCVYCNCTSWFIIYMQLVMDTLTVFRR